MKNSQKGFIVPVLLAIIALLVISGGVYVYENKKTEVSTVVDSGAQQSNQNQQQTNTQTQQVTTKTQTDINSTVGTKNSTPFSVTILSPNGGEKWDIKSTHAITWNVTGDTNNKLDLYLDQQYYPPGVCATQPCGPFFYKHTIAKNVSSKTAYNWMPATDSTVYVGGEYTVRACLAGSTSNCDSSNAKFQLIDLAKENDKAPVVNSISGPTELTVGQSGTYTISASDPDNDDITYTLAEILSGGQALSNGYGYTLLSTQNNAFSVSFPKTGFYSIYFQVLDKYGKVGGKDITVKVQ